MSELSTPEQRTELPTDRRLGQLRREGAIHFSNELVQIISLISGFYVLTFMWGYLVDDLKISLIQSFRDIASARDLSLNGIYDRILGLMYLIGPHVCVIILSVATMASLAVMLQTKWNIKQRKIDFKLFHLNPIAGLKRIFSLNGWINTGKSLLKLTVILPIGYFALKSFAPAMIMLIHLNVEEVLVYTGAGVSTLFWQVIWALIPFAIFDYAWGRYQWLRQNRMTKSEVKDERKSIEGDEETKRKINAKGLQRVMQRIMSSVPQADVIVTNPTHIAIALKYDRENMSAPIVLAKGKGFLAERIREIGRKSGIPILERKPLARALYDAVEVGGTIPYELFKAVAEVLAYVYRLKNPHAYANRPGGA